MSDPVRDTATSVAFDAASLAQAVSGKVVREGRRAIRGGAVDSRRVEPGNAFFALPGERTDGHRFLVDAAQRGAAALVVTADVPDEEATRLRDSGGPSIIAVGDATVALQQAAAEWRNRFEPLVVGVTGSLAKTSTKEQVAEVLSERWNVLRNTANENNEIGLPLTLLRLGPEHDVAVLEMGMYQRTDIALLAALARPKIGVVTAVRATHLSRAGSIDEIERGKRELVEALPSGGSAILNADDPRVARMAIHVAENVRVITYGFDVGADVRAEHVTSRGFDGMLFELRAAGDAVEVTTPALGRHSVHNALAAAAVGIVAGLDLETIARGLARVWSAPHRTTLIDMGPIKVLDDSYNASPDSMIAALDLLASLPGRHVAILGEMLELGGASEAEHRRVGEHAGQVVDLLVVPDGDYAYGARRGRAAIAFAGRDDIMEVPEEAGLRTGDVVLLKGSRGARMDELLPVLERLAKQMERFG
ncbi:MAG: UDP-N-acetylmuramoyl-tripeptide--D-alanyl-D-alanine ligase [Chloroflexota bacterium]